MGQSCSLPHAVGFALVFPRGNEGSALGVVVSGMYLFVTDPRCSFFPGVCSGGGGWGAPKREKLISGSLLAVRRK